MTVDLEPIIDKAIVNWGIGTDPILKLETATEITRWFGNFHEAEKEVIAHLVPAMQVVTEPQINLRIKEISQDLNELLGSQLSSACLLPLGQKINDSGAKFIYGFDKQLSDGTKSVTFSGSVSEAADRFETLIFVDDLVGSGGQAIKAFEEQFESLNRRLIYAPIFAFEDGIAEIDARAGYDRIVVGEKLSSNAKAFSDDSTKFPDSALRSELKEICHKHGARLYRRGPLGYEDTQALISFPHNCPNNTLPVIWAGKRTDERERGERWYPLRERIKVITPKVYGPSPAQELEKSAPISSGVIPSSIGAMGLSRECRKIHSALSLIGQPFSVEILEVVSTGVDGPSAPLAYLEEAEKNGLIDKNPTGGWKLLQTPDRAHIQLSNRERRNIAGSLVSLLLDNLRKGDSSPFDPTAIEVAAAQKILKVYDGFGHFDRRKLRLQEAICRNLERYGDYKELVMQLRYEKANLRARSFETYWYDFRIARTLYYIGEIDAAVLGLGRVYHELADKAVSGDRRQSKELNLKTSIVRQLCQILADTGHPEIAVKLMLKIVMEADVTILDHTVAMMNMLGLSRALALSGHAPAAISISDEIVEQRYKGFLTAMSKAVSGVHRAIGLSNNGSPELAVHELGAHVDFFRRDDKRACCWALTERAAANLRYGEYENVAADIKEIISISREMNILTLDAVALLSDASILEKIPDLVGEVGAFLTDRDDVVSRIKSEGQNLRHSRLVEHVALELDADLDEEVSFDVQDLKLLTPLSHPKLNSKVMRTFLSSERKDLDELESKLDDLFEEYRGQEGVIFSAPAFNNVIVEACKRRKLLNRKYIYPFLKIIHNQYGGILLFYARYFELVNDLENAETCLGKVRNKRTFAYLNVEANIAGKKDFEEGLRLNEQVLRTIPDFFHQQRSRIHNNIAHLIHEYRKRSLYQGAIAHCEMSINLNSNPKFFFPRNLLLTLRLETGEVEQVSAILFQHHERFRPPIRALELAVKNVRNRERRDAAVTALREGLHRYVN